MNNKKQTDEEMLLNSGREHASQIIQAVIKNSPDVDSLNANLHIANCSAIHILATNAFNRMMTFKISKEDISYELLEAISEEIDAIEAQKDNLATHDPKKES